MINLNQHILEYIYIIFVS